MLSQHQKKERLRPGTRRQRSFLSQQLKRRIDKNKEIQLLSVEAKRVSLTTLISSTPASSFKPSRDASWSPETSCKQYRKYKISLSLLYFHLISTHTQHPTSHSIPTSHKTSNKSQTEISPQQPTLFCPKKSQHHSIREKDV